MQTIELNELVSLLRQLEPIFHAACPDATEADFERLVAPDFWEVGASGKIYDRAFALRVLKNRQTTPLAELWQASDYAVRQVGEHVFLLTYTLTQPNRVTRRMTVWSHAESGWQALYHQGTVVSG
jgi:hypothetical protein